jgi:NADH-quinone oxidoreductase subunit E
MAEQEIEYPKKQEDSTVYEFTPEELALIEKHVSKYPTRQSAVMPALWIAQEKWGWLPQGAIQLVADTLGLSFAHVYGVATFYTMYLKEYRAKYLVEICTCFTCGICEGQELYEYAKEYLKVDENGVSPDKMFYLREAECLGACDTAPVLQFNNRTIVHKLNKSKLEQLFENVRKGILPQYEPVPLYDQTVLD